MTDKEYKKAMARVLSLMNKGDGNLTVEEMEETKSLAKKCQEYERKFYSVDITGFDQDKYIQDIQDELKKIKEAS